MNLWYYAGKIGAGSKDAGYSTYLVCCTRNLSRERTVIAIHKCALRIPVKKPSERTSYDSEVTLEDTVIKVQHLQMKLGLRRILLEF